jgi:hypothetical protein
MINRNHLLVGGIRPHYYCLPVAKRSTHQLALRAAATSGDPRFFLGTDSAPHTDANKETACGCAGVFSATNTMSCLAHVFEEEGALDKLEGFASLHGPPSTACRRTRRRSRLKSATIPVDLPREDRDRRGPVTVFDPGHPLHWRRDLTPENSYEIRILRIFVRKSDPPRGQPMIPSTYPDDATMAQMTARMLLDIARCISTPTRSSPTPRANRRPPISTAAS